MTLWVSVSLWCAGIFGVAQKAEAYQIKRVVRQTCTLATGSEVVSVDIGGAAPDANCNGTTGEANDDILSGDDLDTDRSVLFVTNSINYTDHTRTNVMSLIDGPTDLLFARRNGANAGTTVDYQAVEFASGVKVVSGVTTIAENKSTKTVTLPQSFDLTKSFPLITLRAFTGAESVDERNLLTAKLTASNKLKLDRNEQANSYVIDVAYQVVGFDKDGVADPDASVQSGEYIIDGVDDDGAGPGTDDGLTLTMPITAVNAAKSFLVFTIRPDAAVNGIERDYAVDGQITNAGTRVTFNKATTAVAVTVDWYVVELKDAVLAQAGRVGSASFTGTSYAVGSSDGFSTAAVTQRSFAVVAGASGLVGTTTSNPDFQDGLDEILVRGQFPIGSATTTTLNLTRETGQSTGINVPWFVAEMPPLHLKTPNGGSSYRVGAPVSITWDCADSADNKNITIQLVDTGATPGTATLISGDANAKCDANTNTGSWTWTIEPTYAGPGNVLDGDANNFKIKISEPSDASVGNSGNNYDQSDAGFEIRGSLTVTTPNGTETNANGWKVGSSQTIAWTNWGDFDGAGQAGKVSYSTNGGGSWTQIAGAECTDLGADSDNPAATAGVNDGCPWTVDDIIGSNVMVEVALSGDDQASCTPGSSTKTCSRSPVFHVIRDLALAAQPPATITSQNILTINWNFKGWTNWGTVKLEYTTDNGDNWNLMDSDDVGTATDSDALPVNNNNGVPADPKVNNPGSYNWDVPNSAVTSGATARIRITSNSAPTITSVTSSAFTINPSVRVDYPTASGLTFKVGETAPTDMPAISWTVSPTIGDLKVCYNDESVNQTYCESGEVLISSTDANNDTASTGHYNWTVPNAVGSNFVIYLEDVLNAAYNDVSNNAFTINQRIISVKPFAGDYPYTSAIDINWTPQGNMSSENVRIKLLDSGDVVVPAVDCGGGVQGIKCSVGGGSHGVQQTWSWDPATTSTAPGTYKIKVVKLDGTGTETGIAGTSSGTFRVRGILAFTDPTATETLLINQTKTVTWSKTPASIGNVKIEYSIDSGQNYIGTVTNNDSTTSKNWVVPLAALVSTSADDVWLKLSSVNNLADAVISVPLKTRGDLNMLDPLGHATDPTQREILRVGQTYTIQWESVDFLGAALQQGDQQLAYSLDGSSFVTFDTVTETSTSAGWAPPKTAQDETVKLRVRAADYSDVESLTNWLIIRPYVELTKPNGGEQGWTVDDARAVEWKTYASASAVPTVNLYYATDGNQGSPTWVLINTGPCAGPVTYTPDANDLKTCAWTIPPAAVSSNVKVKVSISTEEGAGQDPNSFDPSNAVFTVSAGMSWADPLANAVLRVGSDYTLKWNNNGAVPTSPTPNISLQYKNSGGSYADIVTYTDQTAHGQHSHPWNNIPQAARDATELRVKWDKDDPNPPTLYALRAITILPSLDLTSPDDNPGAGAGYDPFDPADHYHLGDPIAINFTHTGKAADVWKLYYSTDGGLTYPAGQAIATVDATTVTPLNGHTFSCTSKVSPVACTWTPATTLNALVDNDIKIRVELVGQTANVNDESLNPMRVLGKLVLTEPDASGVVWTVDDTTRKVKWTPYGITAVNILLSKNNGGDTYSTTIASGQTGNSYNIPAVLPAWVCQNDTVACQVRVVAADTSPKDNLTFATSANAFRIKPHVVLTNGNGGVSSASLIVGDGNNPAADRKIKWAVSGTIPTGLVELYYTMDVTTADGDGDGIPDPPPGTWQPIAVDANAVLASGGGTGYDWVSIPATAITPAARIVITAKDDNTVKHVLGASTFKLRGNVKVDQPASSSLALPIDTDYDIKWTETGVLGGTLKIEYSTNAFADENETYTAVGPPPGNASGAAVSPVGHGQQGTFPWRVPNAVSGSVKIRVTNSADSDVVDVSAQPFSIVGSLFMDNPVPGEILTAEASYNIKWHKFGTINWVDLHYSKDGGADGYQYPIAIHVAAGDADPAIGGSLLWPGGVPGDTIGNQFRMRVRNNGNPNQEFDCTGADPCTTVAAANNFKIKGDLTITAPVGSAKRYVTAPFTISWTPKGAIGDVKIDYSTNAFADESQTVNLADNYTDPGNSLDVSGGVPDAISETFAIRVKSKQADASLVASQPSTTFPVRGKIVMQTPDPASPGSFTLGDSIDITWNSTGSIGSVRIDYDDGQGSSWVPATMTAPEDGPLNGFKIDDRFCAVAGCTTNGTVKAAPAAKLRICDADGDLSDVNLCSETTPFLVKAYLAVTKPDANMLAYSNTTDNIKWDYKGSNVANVKIEYTTNGTAWNHVQEAEGANDGIVANDGKFTWTVPGALTPNPTFQIRMQTEPQTDAWAVADKTSGLFKIIGQLTLRQPGDGDATGPGVQWRIDTTGNQIIWDAIGDFSAVKLDYNTGGCGQSSGWTNITTAGAGGTGNDKTYPWTIAPDAPITKDTLCIRACDNADSSICDKATAASSLLAKFTNLTPSNGTVVIAETATTIFWTTPEVNKPSQVKLRYDVGGGWQNVGGGTGIFTNDGDQSWTPGAALTESAMLEISDKDDPASALPGTTFKVRGAVSAVTAPTGQDAWELNTENNIVWTYKGNIATFALEITDDATVVPATNIVWVPLVDGHTTPLEADNIAAATYCVAKTCTWPWKLPATQNVTTKARVRVLDANEPSVKNYGPADPATFTIKGHVTLIGPLGGTGPQPVYLNDGVATIPITGTVFGPINSVRLLYSTNGSTFPNPVNGCVTVSVNSGAFSCDWDPPDSAIGINFKIRAEDAGNNLVGEESPDTFAIKGKITFTDPIVTTTAVTAGEDYTVVYDKAGGNTAINSLGTLTFSYRVYSAGAWGSWTQFATNVTAAAETGNTVTWPVPDGSLNPIVSGQVELKVAGSGLYQEYSSDTFPVKGKVTLTTPDPVAPIARTLRDTFDIEWTAKGDIGPVKVEYCENAADPTSCKTVNASAFQNGPQSITLGPQFTAGNAFGTTKAVASAKIKICDPEDCTNVKSETVGFLVKAYLAVTKPDADLLAYSNATDNIQWGHEGSNVTNVKIEYTTNGTAWNPVQESEGANDGIVANDGKFTWTVPGALTPNPTFQIRMQTEPQTDAWAVANKTSGLFKITGQLTLTQPNDTTGIKWRIDSSENEFAVQNQITWDAVGDFTAVKLDYHTGGCGQGSGWTNITAAGAGGTGNDKSYLWTILPTAPITKDTLCLRACDNADSSVCDKAEAASSLLAQFTGLTPSGGVVVPAETSTTIFWTTPEINKPSYVKLRYNVGGGWQNVGGGTGIFTNDGDQGWTPPATLSESAQLEISDSNDPASALPGTTFKVRGAVTAVTAPTGQDAWELNTEKNIVWTYKGDIQTFALEVTTDATVVPASNIVWVPLVDGHTTPLEADNIAAATYCVAKTCTWPWKLPATQSITTKGRIQVLDANEPSVKKDGPADPATFTIKGHVTLAGPLGGTGPQPVYLNDGVATIPITGTVFGPINSVRLLYSTNGSTFPNPVNGCVTVNVNGGTFSCDWDPPDSAIGVNFKIRAEDATNNLVGEESPDTFAIKGKITFTDPIVTTTAVTAGEDYTVVYRKEGGNTAIDNLGTGTFSYRVYSAGAWGSWTPFTSNVTSTAAVGNTVTWPVPDGSLNPIVSGQVELKMTHAGLYQEYPSDTFPVKGKLTLTTPDPVAPIARTLGDTFSIEWDAQGDIGPVKVQYCENAADPNSCKTVNAAAFQNGPQSITLGPQFTAGNAFGTTKAVTNAKIKICDPEDCTNVKSETVGFLVSESLTVDEPNGDNWVVGSTPEIKWTSKASNITQVKIEYTTDGSAYNTIDETEEGTNNDGIVTNDGSFMWLVPPETTANPTFDIKVSSIPTAAAYAKVAGSPGLNKIIGWVNLTAPTRGEVLGMGTTYSVKWSASAGIQNVRLRYTPNGGTNWYPIINSVPAANGASGQDWFLNPASTSVSTTVQVEVADAADANTVYKLGPDDGNPANDPDYVRIVPTFTITFPDNDNNGGNPERVAVDPTGTAKYRIKWLTSGSVTTVDLRYWADLNCGNLNGSGTPVVNGTGANNTGQFDWTVPDFADLATGPLCGKVRVAWPTDTMVFDDSDTFVLGAGMKVTSPDGLATDKFDYGKPLAIKWTSTSQYPALAKVSYSSTGVNGTYNALKNDADNSGNPGDERSWTWPAPSVLSDQVSFKVELVNDADAVDTSNSPSEIKTFFNVLTPSASIAPRKVDESYEITWVSDPGIQTIPLVKLAYSKNPDDAVPTWENILDGASTTTDNDGSFWWTVPDDITTAAVVKVRVLEDGNPDAFDLSNNPFKIEGVLTIQTPNGNANPALTDKLPVGFSRDITWLSTGTMDFVNLVAYTTVANDPYFRDTAGTYYAPGTVFVEATPYPIISNLANNPDGQTTTHPWNPVPDLASPNVKVKVIDAGDSAVSDPSNFPIKIQGSFTLTYPNASTDVLKIGDIVTIQWDKTGSSITEAKISYSLNGTAGPWTPITEVDPEGPPVDAQGNPIPDDGIVSNDKTARWLVPDVLALAPVGMPKDNVLIKIESPSDSSVFDYSGPAANGDPFKIVGQFAFMTPGLNNRWVTNENHLVTWTQQGTITLVNLVYSKDNFQSSTPIVSNLAPQAVYDPDTGAYLYHQYQWRVPDVTIPPQNTKLRVIDANDTSVTKDSAQFQIDHYTLTVSVRDLLSNSHVSAWTMTATNTSSTDLPLPYTWNENSLSSPYPQPLEAGTWNLTVSHPDFGDASKTVLVTGDSSVTFLMESKVVHIWDATTEAAYVADFNDTGVDRLVASATLRRDGVTISGADLCEIKIYEPGNPNYIKKFTTDGPPDAIGFYNYTWDNTGLQNGVVYNMVTTIRLGTTGALLTTPRTLSVTQEKALENVKDKVMTQLDTSLSHVRDDVKDIIQDRMGFTDADVASGKTMKSEMAAQTGAITGALTSFEQKSDVQIAALKSAAGNIQLAGEDVKKRSEDLEATNLKFAGRLVMPRTVLINDKDVLLSYQATSGLLPLITIITQDQAGKEVVVVQSVPMAQNPTRADVYDYTISKITSPPYRPGKFVTVTVESDIFTYKLQPEKGRVKNLEVGSFIVESTTLSTLEGLVAGQSGVKDIVSDTMAMMRALQGALGGAGTANMMGLLQAMSAKIDAMPREIAAAVAAQGNTVDMRNTLNEVAQQIRTLAGNNMGYDFSKIVGKALDESSSMKDIRKKADAVQGTTEVMQVLMEQKFGGVDAPVVHVIYQ